MSAGTKQDRATIRSLNFEEEIKLRMERYHTYQDMFSLLNKAYKMYRPQFHKAVGELSKKSDAYDSIKNESLLSDEQLKNFNLVQIEEIANAIHRSGFEFLEMGQKLGEQRFFNYIPIYKQPSLEELFLNAVKREVETVEFHLARSNFNKIYFDDSTIKQLENQETSLVFIEKVAQELFTPAFELIKREYILIMTRAEVEYSAHHAFDRLSLLSEGDKLTVMDYVRFTIQGDGVITSAETDFVDQILSYIQLKKFNKENYFKVLLKPITFHDLRPLFNVFSKRMLNQVLCLIIDCAYSDRILTTTENTRLLQIAEFIIQTGTKE